MVRLLAGALAALLALLAGPGTPALATHEPDHRYVVLGYVKDGAGRPLAGATVRVVRARTGLAYPARTDGEGFYLVVVHLHDEDLGEILTVSAAGASAKITATFDPRDKRVERGTRVDIEGGRVVERRALFATTLKEVLDR